MIDAPAPDIVLVQEEPAAGEEIALADPLRPELIVVTGERRIVSLSETPRSVSVLTADELRFVDPDHPSEVLNRAAGVNIQRGNGVESLTAIRSPVLTGGAGAGSFLYLEDGVPVRSAGFANTNGLFESHIEIAEAVEVVRGPSGALYGANAVHGVIDVRTPESSLAERGFLSLSGDTEDRYGGSLVLSGGRGRQAALIGVTAVTEDGFRADAGLDQQKLTLRHTYFGDAVTVRSVLGGYNLNQETAGFAQGDDAYLDATARRANAFPEAYRDSAGARASSRVEIELGETEVVLTPFARWTEMEFLQHFLPSRAIEDTGHWSVGAQSGVYHQASERLELIAGLDIERTRGFLKENQTIPDVFSFTQGVHYDYSVVAHHVSPFAKASYQLTARLEASLAARIDYTRYAYDNELEGEPEVVGRFRRAADRADAFTTASPKASLLYRTDAGAIYASYARGARPPQTTDLYRLQINQQAGEVDPETIDAAELGWRGAAGPLDWDLAAFAMEKRNFFFRDADGFNVPDGKTRHIGLEWRVRFEPAAWATLETAGTLAEHTYRFSRDIGAIGGLDSEDISEGDEVDAAPTTLANTRLTLRPSRALRLEAEWVHVGAYFLNASNTEEYPGHDILNLRAAVRLPRDVEAFAALRNALDAFYAERADFAFGNERYFPAEERTLAFGLRARF
ncbi:MAG: TonB-dependent receptor [Pseudomonadota bacterium]